MKKDKHLQKGSLQTKYLVKTMSLFLDPIFKWQWKHYIMFEKKEDKKFNNIYYSHQFVNYFISEKHMKSM